MYACVYVAMRNDKPSLRGVYRFFFCIRSWKVIKCDATATAHIKHDRTKVWENFSMNGSSFRLRHAACDALTDIRGMSVVVVGFIFIFYCWIVLLCIAMRLLLLTFLLYLLIALKKKREIRSSAVCVYVCVRV